MKELNKEKLGRDRAEALYRDLKSQNNATEDFIKGFEKAENHYKPLLEEAVGLLNGVIVYKQGFKGERFEEDLLHLSSKIHEFLNKIEKQ